MICDKTTRKEIKAVTFSISNSASVTNWIKSSDRHQTLHLHGKLPQDKQIYRQTRIRVTYTLNVFFTLGIHMENILSNSGIEQMFIFLSRIIQKDVLLI